MLVQLRQKVDDFFADVSDRVGDAMACQSGCHACCQPGLTVCDVEAEALDAAIRALSEAELDSLRGRVAAPAAERCVLLDREGLCSVYAARPLVCRSQGLPLRYEPGTLAEAQILAQGHDAEVAWCLLNFREGPPGAADILDAQRVDQTLALINRSETSEPLRRTGLLEIARRAIAR